MNVNGPHEKMLLQEIFIHLQILLYSEIPIIRPPMVLVKKSLNSERVSFTLKDITF